MLMNNYNTIKYIYINKILKYYIKTLKDIFSEFSKPTL